MTDSSGKGRLTTHVLDTANGRPAAGVRIELIRLDGDARLPVSDQRTNSDGRTDTPMMAGDDMTAGTYELVFHAGDYLKGAVSELPENLFLDRIPIRFGIADAGAHYHVPLLISPYGYSTYRGS